MTNKELTPSEIFKALQAGCRMHRLTWKSGEYIYLDKDGWIRTQDGIKWLTGFLDGLQVYIPKNVRVYKWVLRRPSEGRFFVTEGSYKDAEEIMDTIGDSVEVIMRIDASEEEMEV